MCLELKREIISDGSHTASILLQTTLCTRENICGPRESLYNITWRVSYKFFHVEPEEDEDEDEDEEVAWRTRRSVTTVGCP